MNSKATMGEWQPIETMPKDGTRVILLVDGVAFEGLWEPWQGLSMEHPDRGLLPLEYLGHGTATHWMTRPDNPAAH